MATAKIIVVEKNKGEKIAYEVSGTKIIFGFYERSIVSR